MASIDIGHVVSSSYQGTSPAGALACTIGAGDNLLLVQVGAWNSNGLLSGVTYGGVAMTLVPSSAHVDTTSGLTGVSWWYMNNPTVGTANIVVSAASSFTALGLGGVPCSGVNLALPPIAGVGADANNTAAACSVVGGVASLDVYLATMFTHDATLTPAGAPQVNLAIKTAINTLGAWSADYIPAASAGNFSWTLATGVWTAIGILLKGIASGGSGAISGSGVSGGLVSSGGPTGTGYISGSPVSKISIP